jgi:hypothetical protein
MKHPTFLRVIVAMALACAASAQAPAAPKLEIHDSARVRITRSSVRLEGDVWIVAGQVRGSWPAHAARKRVLVELRDAGGQPLWTQTLSVRLQPRTLVRDKHGWGGSFRLTLPLPAGACPATASLRTGAGSS